MQLNLKRTSVISGIVCALGFLSISMWIVIRDGSTGRRNVISKVYRGFNFSVPGSLIGSVWAFVDGLLCGAAYAWLHNRITNKRVR
ncbi:MAG: hypothetical protein HN356_09445 [Calditrichaeota bacterium]|jgi:hypothetical protein|nr:hypothetical protein [Calditrichota bacterium]MBT7618586.1 hypothetical protein [Calditrichota bacterium]MBT7787469.1 hypothetical protein [Calditrichota bacterium]